MIIDDPDAFKTWLTAVLKPICEADPGTLAKYVFALVKKDKSPELLRESMINQLEVFLQTETEPFINRLFKTLDARDYLIPVIPSANPPNPHVSKLEVAVPIVQQVLQQQQQQQVAPLPPKVKDVKKEIIPLSELPTLTETVNGSTTTATSMATSVAATVAPPPVVVVARKEIMETKRDARKSESEKEKPRRRSRHRSLSRGRSRSKSWERRRSRSPRDRERDPRRERPRTYRNKSPPRRFERRRSRSLSPAARSPQRHAHRDRGRYRNRSPPRSGGSRSRSRSNERKKEQQLLLRDLKDARSGAATPTQDSNHGDMDLRLTNAAQSIQSVVVHAGANRSPKARCRDYDEKGFCMRGEMCPFDHGVDPVVLEDTTLSSVLSFGPNGVPVPDVPPPMVSAPMMGNPPPHHVMHMPPRPLMPEYNPQAPQMWHRQGFRGGPRPMTGPRLPPMSSFLPAQGGLQRELIPVPVMDNNQQDKFVGGPPRHHYGFDGGERMRGPGGGGVPFKKKNFDYNRLGPRAKNPSNCSLELKKVPPGLNNITHLNNHFAKFGRIVNIQVFFDGDPEAAIVTFSSHAEANAAFRSTEAVLNNRFIKVFWHSGNGEGKQENVPPRSVKDRLGMPTTLSLNSNKVFNLVQMKAENEENDTPAIIGVNTTTNGINNNALARKDETKVQEAAAIVKSQELLAAKERFKKNQEEKRKEALKITQNLRKRKQELLEKQLAQQKLLIDKVEKTPPGVQRDLLLQTIKKSVEATEAIRKDMLHQAAPVAAKIHVPRKSKEETQKEMLDAELDLITKQQEGADTSEIQRKLYELKARMTVGVVAGGVRGRGMRGRRFNPLNRHLLTKNNLTDATAGAAAVAGWKGNLKTVNKFQKHAVDHRPTRVLVSGYETDEQESVLTFFEQFGEVADYVTDPHTPSVIINYKTRKEAEVALIKGKHFQDRTLSITWCTNVQLANQMSEIDEEHLISSQGFLDGDADVEHGGTELSEEVLLQDDEEENDDEDNEGRSWRR